MQCYLWPVIGPVHYRLEGGGLFLPERVALFQLHFPKPQQPPCPQRLRPQGPRDSYGSEIKSWSAIDPWPRCSLEPLGGTHTPAVSVVRNRNNSSATSYIYLMLFSREFN